MQEVGVELAGPEVGQAKFIFIPPAQHLYNLIEDVILEVEWEHILEVNSILIFGFPAGGHVGGQRVRFFRDLARSVQELGLFLDLGHTDVQVALPHF